MQKLNSSNFDRSRNLVARRLGAQVAERPERGPTLPQPLRIVLDETVIPQKYARVLVRALYVDSIDFDLVDEKNLEIGDRLVSIYVL